MNVHIRETDFSDVTHSRVYKEAKSLLRAKITNTVCLVGVTEKTRTVDFEIEPGIIVYNIGLATNRLPVKFFFQVIKYIEWNLRVIFFLLKKRKKISSIQSHSLSSLFAGVIGKIFTHCILIYDAHELETETCRLEGHFFRKQLSRFFERFFIKFCDKVIVVGNEIAEWYKLKYSIEKPVIVRNIPNVKRNTRKNTKKYSNLLRKECGIPANDLIFLYIGMIKEGRGIERWVKIWEAGKFSDRHLVFMGPVVKNSAFFNSIIKKKNIHYHPPVSGDKVVDYAAGADVAIYIISNDSLNDYLCLPNKLFEGLLSGLPLLFSNGLEIAKFVNTYDCGWGLPYGTNDDSQAVVLIQSITQDDIEKKKTGSILASQSLSWENEAEVIVEVYQNLDKKINND